MRCNLLIYLKDAPVIVRREIWIFADRQSRVCASRVPLSRHSTNRAHCRMFPLFLLLLRLQVKNFVFFEYWTIEH